MKKRYHTNQSRYNFSLNKTISNRSIRRSLKGIGQVTSETLASDTLKDEKLANFSEFAQETKISPSQYDENEGLELKLVDEISKNELKDFAFNCIESLASLAGSEKKSKNKLLDEVLAEVVSKKLNSFTDLAQERKEARAEFKEYVAWSKQFIASTQPLLNSNGPAEEVDLLNSQITQCVERSMAQKYRSSALGKRVDFLLEAVADYVRCAGVELGLPEPIMGKVAQSVRGALMGASSV